MSASPLATLDIDATLDLVRSGVLMKSIAEPLGVTKEAIRKRLMQHPEYQEAIKEQAASLVERATEFCFDESLTPLEVGIARVRLDAAHKYAAARDPATWGNKTQLSGPGGNPLQINNISITFVAPEQQCSATIEHEPAGKIERTE